MYNFLNIITDDLDDIDGHFFYSNRKWSGDEKIDLFLKREVFDSHSIDKIKRCTLDDAINNSDEIFYYFITCLRSLHSVFEKYNTLPIHEKLFNTLKTRGNVKIIIYNNNEPDDSSSFFSLNNYVIDQRLSPNLFYFVNNNAILQEIKNNYFSNINVYSSRDLIINFARRYNSVNTPFIGDKKYLFSCYNGHAKIHRYATLSLIKYNNILDKCDWSLIYGVDYKKNYLRQDGITPDYNSYSKIFDMNNIIDLKNEIDYFSSIDKKVSEFETNIDVNDPREYTGNDLYTQSYINIVTESMFTDRDVVHITEKTIRPFQFYQIPIFIATPNHVKKIRERYRLDLFDDIVNHSYDYEHGDNARIFSIINEIRRLSNEESHIREFYKKNRERFEYNRNIVKEISEDKSDNMFFVSIANQKPKEEYINIVYDNLLSNDSIKSDIENTRNFLFDMKITNYKLYKLDEIKNFKNDKFFIFLYHNMWFSEIVNDDKSNIFKGDFLNTLIENKNLYVVLINIYEADSPFFIEFLSDFIKKIGLSENRFVVINNNEFIHKLKNKLNINILFTTTDKLIRLSAIKSTRIVNNYFNSNREYLFMCFNRIIKTHRVCLLTLLKHHDILYKTDWSLLFGNQLKENWLEYFSEIFNEEQLVMYKNSIDYIANIGIVKSKYEENIKCPNPFDCIEYLDSYNHSYINLVTETFFIEENSIHITEKSFIPFNFYQIPIFIAPAGHVKSLREKYNFDLFDDLIDHGYDDEIDNNKRFHLIVNQIIKLSKMGTEIKEYFIKNENRFHHNKNILSSYININNNYEFLVNLPNNVE